MIRSWWSSGQSGGQLLLVGLDGRPGGLDVEVEGHPRVAVQQLEDLVEGGDTEIVVARGPTPVGIGPRFEARADVGPGGEPVGVVEGPDLGQGQRVDGTLAVGGPVDGGVMGHHQVAVEGGVDVELDPGGPELQGPADGEEGRRGRFPRSPLMGVGDDPAPEPGVAGGGSHSPTVASAHARPHPGGRHHPDPKRPGGRPSPTPSGGGTLPGRRLPGRRLLETSYSLPGEEKPPRVRADVSVDWPTWSQSSYRSWSIGEPPEDLPEVVVEITLRLQRLSVMPDLELVLACLPRGESSHRYRQPGPGRPRRRTGPRAGRARPPLRRGDLLSGDHPPDETALEDTSTLAGPASQLARWVASVLVRLGDLRLTYLPPDPSPADTATNHGATEHGATDPGPPNSGGRTQARPASLPEG